MKLMVKISVQVHPGVWHIKVAAPPVEGKANDALIKFLGTTLDIPKSRISLEKGATSRHKIIAIEGLSEEQVCSLLLPS
jgi:uncharacterized protein (TIGR00251 family)